MKIVLLSLILIVFSHQLYADCAGDGVYFWPVQPTVKQNAIFIIETYANSMTIIDGLNKEYRIYLKSNEDKVALVVTEINKGEYFLSQAVLKPERNLTPGLTYELYIDNFNEDEKPMTKWSSKLNKFEPVAWKVEKGEDKDIPVWTQKPTEVKKTYELFGCGPAVNVHFNFAIYDSSPVLIKANVTNLKTEKITSYCLDATNLTTIQIGYDMCSGAFLHDEGEQYEITFDIMDSSGNFAKWNYTSIKFAKPAL